VTREVIRRMGLDAAVRAARTETAGAYTVDADGKVLETYRADDDGSDGYISEIEILRGDLSRVLPRRLPPAPGDRRYGLSLPSCPGLSGPSVSLPSR
jgi:hypothetical protein